MIWRSDGRADRIAERIAGRRRQALKGRGELAEIVPGEPSEEPPAQSRRRQPRLVRQVQGEPSVAVQEGRSDGGDVERVVGKRMAGEATLRLRPGLAPVCEIVR